MACAAEDAEGDVIASDTSVGMVLTYMGRPATELTREELLEALEHACKELMAERSAHQMSLDILSPTKGRR